MTVDPANDPDWTLDRTSVTRRRHVHALMANNVNKLKIVVLGSGQVGKSAVTVRYLTKRYIGEYSSNKDFVYHHSVTFDEVTNDVEILDTSRCQVNDWSLHGTWPRPRGHYTCSSGVGFGNSGFLKGFTRFMIGSCMARALGHALEDIILASSSGCLHEHLVWGDAFVVVYSICDRESFSSARDLLEKIQKTKVLRFVPVILLGNKRDLDHSRRVAVDDGHELSLSYGCQFYEVSAADNYVGVSLAFSSVLREARSVQLLRTIPIRRRLGVITVSKMFGMVFGKSAKSAHRNGKKRPSLSI